MEQDYNIWYAVILDGGFLWLNPVVAKICTPYFHDAVISYFSKTCVQKACSVIYICVSGTKKGEGEAISCSLQPAKTKENAVCKKSSY